MKQASENKASGFQTAPRQSMSRRLTVSVVLTVLVVSAVVIAYNYRQSSRLSARMLELRAEEYVHNLANSLELPLWQFDHQTVARICDSFADDEMAVGLQVLDSGFRPVYEKKKKPGQAPVLERGRDIINEGRFVGQVRIDLSQKLYQELNRKQLKGSIVMALVVAAALTGLTMFIVRVFLRRPLDHLSGLVERCRVGDFELWSYPPPSIEFQPFAAVLARMGDRICRQMNELREKEISLTTELADGLRPVEMDRVQMEQVFLNLLINAWQAMPAGGEILIGTENQTLGQRETGPYNLAPGPYVKIIVSDSGQGMDENVKARIFDPFFTTKPDGVGLGLSTAYGIVKNHAGFINVYSEPGRGSVFNIYLPAGDQEPPDEKSRPEAAAGGSETILLVDDEPLVAEVGAEMLEMLGYRVITAASGEEAEEKYVQNHEAVSLVILDMIMPGRGGGLTFERLRAIDPDVAVLLSSGYSLEGQAREIMDRGCRGFIQKPFNMKALAEKVREILDLD